MTSFKHLMIFIACTSAFLSINAQIKVFSGGNTIVGSTNSPVSGAKLQVTGTTIFTTATGTVTPTSAAYIPSVNAYSTAGMPDYTWSGDIQTGIFHPASATLGITIGNSEKFRFNSSGQILNSNNSSASTPSYSWNGDANTGLYNPSADILGFVTNGTEAARLINNGALLLNAASQGSGNEKLRVIATSGDNTAVRIDVNHSTDWRQSMITFANRANTTNYVVNYGGADNFYVAGSGWVYYAAGSYLSSDSTLKQEVTRIDSAMSKINRIKGVTYKLKKEMQHPELYPVANRYMGVLAQEIEAVAPEAVRIVHDGTKAVSYEMLIGLLIEALKEQNQQVAQLETKLDQCCLRKPATDPGTSNRSISTNEALNDQTSSNWLAQNKPNPFNKETVIEYNVVQEGKASILVFDMNGKLLKTIPVKIPGRGSITIQANDFTAGMYYYSLVVNDAEVDTKKMILTE